MIMFRITKDEDGFVCQYKTNSSWVSFSYHDTQYDAVVRLAAERIDNERRFGYVYGLYDAFGREVYTKSKAWFAIIYKGKSMWRFCELNQAKKDDNWCMSMITHTVRKLEDCQAMLMEHKLKPTDITYMNGLNTGCIAETLM